VVESSALLKNLKRPFIPSPPVSSSLVNSKCARQLQRIAFLLGSLTSSNFIPQTYLFDLPFLRNREFAHFSPVGVTKGGDTK